MEAIIFDVRRFCVHDGPGIRTTVFFKGCPLRCLWCHNPESFHGVVEEQVRTVHMDGKAYEITQTIGRTYHVEDLIVELLRDTLFFESSAGGITLSGGEPLMQTDFLAELMPILKQHGIHVALDTCGHAAEKDFQRIVNLVDLVLFDVKHLDDQRHQTLTGVSNQLILKNLNWLRQSGIAYCLRYPVVPSSNDDERNLLLMERLLVDHQGRAEALHLLPFHAMAHAKYQRMGIPWKMEGGKTVDESQLRTLQERFSAFGIPVIIGG